MWKYLSYYELHQDLSSTDFHQRKNSNRLIHNLPTKEFSFLYMFSPVDSLFIFLPYWRFFQEYHQKRADQCDDSADLKHVADGTGENSLGFLQKDAKIMGICRGHMCLYCFHHGCLKVFPVFEEVAVRFPANDLSLAWQIQDSSNSSEQLRTPQNQQFYPCF